MATITLCTVFYLWIFALETICSATWPNELPDLVFQVLRGTKMCHLLHTRDVLLSSLMQKWSRGQHQNGIQIISIGTWWWWLYLCHARQPETTNLDKPDSRESRKLDSTACPQTAPHFRILPEKCAPVLRYALKIPEKPSTCQTIQPTFLPCPKGNRLSKMICRQKAYRTTLSTPCKDVTGW